MDLISRTHQFLKFSLINTRFEMCALIQRRLPHPFS